MALSRCMVALAGESEPHTHYCRQPSHAHSSHLLASDPLGLLRMCRLVSHVRREDLFRPIASGRPLPIRWSLLARWEGKGGRFG